jgi:hypothetical protein
MKLLGGVFIALVTALSTTGAWARPIPRGAPVPDLGSGAAGVLAVVASLAVVAALAFAPRRRAPSA